MAPTDSDLEYATRMPKVDLHVHLTGTLRAETFAELAAREGVELPEDPLVIFDKINSRAKDLSIYRDAVLPVPTGPVDDEPKPSYGLFMVFDWLRQCIVTEDDLTRVAYEACEDAATKSNTRHIEYFMDPASEYPELGYARVVDAYIRGLEGAQEDYGITARLIAGIDRSRTGADAVAQVEEIVANPRDRVVGIGLDNLETAGPPERFVEAFQLAGRHGLRRTAHSSEHAPLAKNTTTCLDDLGCDRIDHGYFVLQDDEVVERCRREQVPFTCIFTTSRRAWRPWRRASVAKMLERGLKISLASDDPGLFPTTLVNEYHIAMTDLGVDRHQLREICLNGVDACWLEDADKQALHRQFTEELDRLERELFEEPGSAAGR